MDLNVLEEREISKYQRGITAHHAEISKNWEILE